MDELEKKVIDFFKRNNIIRNNKRDSIINTPNYFADEAFFLMEEFFVKFNISKGYIDIDKFFNPLPSFSIINLFSTFSIEKKKKPEKPKITIDHLIKVAKKEEWFDPE